MSRNGEKTDSVCRGVAVAVTGGMGAGKSTVAQFLRTHLQWQLLNADLVCRILLAPEGAGWQAFINVFGSGYLNGNGEVNRSELRRRIFTDAPLRKKLEAILHPMARKEIQRRVDRITNAGGSVLVEVPLLFEAGWQDDFAKVVVVYASDAVCLARICRRDGISLDEAKSALSAQMPLKQKAMAADYVIDNSGNWSETLFQLIHLSEILDDLAGYRGKKT